MPPVSLAPGPRASATTRFSCLPGPGRLYTGRVPRGAARPARLRRFGSARAGPSAIGARGGKWNRTWGFGFKIAVQHRGTAPMAASGTAGRGRRVAAGGGAQPARPCMCWTIWRAQHPPTLAQLAQRLAMPKTTLMRLLAAMQRAGFVAATPVERGYVPGPQAGALALATLRASAYTRACRAVLAQLAGTLGETCNPDRAGRRPRHLHGTRRNRRAAAADLRGGQPRAHAAQPAASCSWPR